MSKSVYVGKLDGAMKSKWFHWVAHLNQDKGRHKLIGQGVSRISTARAEEAIIRGVQQNRQAENG
jgi:hypothetical protein